MGRNLYIFAGTLGFFAVISVILSFTSIAHQPGSPGDQALWRTTAIALFCIALITTLGGVLSQLFEQAERRAEADRDRRRGRRRRSPE